MKVFISHSSKDKWAARRISEDIESVGVDTFLDEKDIKTGESIDGSMKEHLSDCDDFLILLSPASLKSEWVLIELGGAMALGKRVVPILLYVGVNEIPKAINLKLARDINDVETYYNELGESLGTSKRKKKAPSRERKEKHTVSLLKVGDRVRIVSSAPGDEYRDRELDTFWVDPMNEYLGRSARITRTAEPQKDDYFLDIDNGRYAWVSSWLIPEK